MNLFDEKWIVLSSHYPKKPKKNITGIALPITENYVQVLFNTILPETDEEYIKEHKEILARTKLASKAPELLKVLIEIKNIIESSEH